MSRKDRQELAQVAAASEAARIAEDASWRDDGDKKGARKAERATAVDAKADARLLAKQERKSLAEAEEVAMSASGRKSGVVVKLTQFEIARRQALACAIAPNALAPKAVSKSAVVPQPRLEPNMNRSDDVAVTGVDAALAALASPSAGIEGGVSTPCSREGPSLAHAFRERTRARLLRDNPSLKDSQVREKVQKLWERSPENPRNQT